MTPPRAPDIDLTQTDAGAVVRCSLRQQYHRVVLIALAALLALNTLDIVLTRVALHHGAVESNPLARALLAGGKVELLKLGLLAVLVVRVLRRPVSFGVVILAAGAVGFYSAVVLANALTLLKLA